MNSSLCDGRKFFFSSLGSCVVFVQNFKAAPSACVHSSQWVWHKRGGGQEEAHRSHLLTTTPLKSSVLPLLSNPYIFVAGVTNWEIDEDKLFLKTVNTLVHVRLEGHCLILKKKIIGGKEQYISNLEHLTRRRKVSSIQSTSMLGFKALRVRRQQSVRQKWYKKSRTPSHTPASPLYSQYGSQCFVSLDGHEEWQMHRGQASDRRQFF